MAMMHKEGEEITFRGEMVEGGAYDGPLWPYLRDRLQSHGSRPALIDPYTEEEMSYGQVLSTVDVLSRSLCTLGLRQGGRLCVCAPNKVETALVMLATLATGGTIHAMNPTSTTGEITRQLHLTGAEIIVTVPQLLENVTSAVANSSVRVIVIGPGNGHMSYDDLIAMDTRDVTIETTYEDPETAVACLLFSSGTTGLPKAVEVTQRNIRAFMHLASLFDGGLVRPEDTAALYLPFVHIYGLVVTLLTGMVVGARLVVVGKFEIDQFLAFCSKYRVSMLYLVPTVVVWIVNHPRLEDYDLSAVRQTLCGAAPLGQEAEAQFVRRMGVPVLQGYGMTETIVVSINSSRRYKAGSCGFVFPNNEIKIVDHDTGKCLGVDQAGDLYVRGPFNMKSYYRNPQATQDAIDKDGWLNTGDVAKIDRDGFVYVVDRRKEFIKYKGQQVAPAVLEDLLLGHPAVSQVCVIGRPDNELGELPMAFVVVADGHTLTAEQVLQFVADNVPNHMQLRGGVEFRKDIPKSPNGKILRRVLRDELKQQLQSKL